MSRVEEVTTLYNQAEWYYSMNRRHNSNPYIDSMFDRLDRDIQLSIAKSLSVIADAMSKEEE